MAQIKQLIAIIKLITQYSKYINAFIDILKYAEERLQKVE